MSEIIEKLERPHCKELDAILGVEHKVLDHGFVRVIDYMGDDAAVVQAARVSYGKGTKKVSDDANLINYLSRNHHSTPFEMCEIKLHCKLPIFVARQWIRHRTASVNEYSARYSEIKDEFYIPEEQQVRVQSMVNRQGRGEVSDAEIQDWFIGFCRALNQDVKQVYDKATGEFGLARELARINVPVSNYTEWYWKIDLRNLLGFLLLRNDPHAQYEIRAYAEVIQNILEQWVPLTMAAWKNYFQEAVTFSREEWKILKEVISATRTQEVKDGLLSKREIDEFYRKTGIILTISS